MKFLTFSLLILACFTKLSVTSFKEQIEYPGIQTGRTWANYKVEIANPKNEVIKVEGIWLKQRWINFLPKSYSGNPITILTSDQYINLDTLKAKIKVPTKNEKHKAVVKYHFKGKSKVRFLGVSEIIKEEPLARP